MVSSHPKTDQLRLSLWYSPPQTEESATHWTLHLTLCNMNCRFSQFSCMTFPDPKEMCNVYHYPQSHTVKQCSPWSSLSLMIEFQSLKLCSNSSTLQKLHPTDPYQESDVSPRLCPGTCPQLSPRGGENRAINSWCPHIHHCPSSPNPLGPD